MKTGVVITLAQYAHELQVAGLLLERIQFLGSDYFCPSPEWLFEFGPYIKSARFDYMPGVWVCEQFARLAAVEADIAWLEAVEKDPSLPRIHHAFGEATGRDYPAPGAEGLAAIGTAHALNLCRCSDGQLYVFDPQNCEDPENIYPLTSARNTFKPDRVRA